MPWIRKELCDGCTACVGRCPATAISVREDLKAFIHDHKCFHCGACAEACRRGAVRPDSERLPLAVKENVRKIRHVLRRRGTPAVLERQLRCVVDHYETQRRLAETTLRELAVLYGRAAAPDGARERAARNRS
jgi:MinD superfamily P-loop ATPase